jgi:hypothetical protein
MNLHYDRTPCRTIAEVIRSYGERELKTATRSTIPLLCWLKYQEPSLNSLLRDMNMPAECSLCFEYQVKPAKGSGGASHTDLMVKSGKFSLAVEAKWTEPQYETIAKWLAKGSNPNNRREVLDGWLSLLRKHATRHSPKEDFSSAVYQIVHRAASACASGEMPKLAYLVFKPSPDSTAANIKVIYNDLANLWILLGRPEKFPFFVVEVKLSHTVAFDEIGSLPKGNKSTAERIRTALLGNNQLFDFEMYSVMRIE